MEASPDAAVLAPQASLGLHEESSEARHGGCTRWPESLRLRNAATGELVRGRCKSTNKCEYCAVLGSIETAEMLSLDAVEHFSPQVWACVGTRTPTFDPKPFYTGREQVLKALRWRWPDTQVATLREFTTGYGPRSRGLRRPHWNMLLKGLQTSDQEEVREVVGRVWCQHVDAEPERQHVGAVSDAGGLGRYLALHFQKESQAPPKGWRGHRFTSSRGYFPEGVRVARERAQGSMRFRRELYKLELAVVRKYSDEERAIPGGLWEWLPEMAEGRVIERGAERWDLAHVLRESTDPERAAQIPVSRVRNEARRALGLG